MHSSEKEQEKRIETLLQEIHAGNDALIYELWDEVDRLCAWYCRKLYNSLPRSFLIEYEDLYNCGFIALWDALAHYDPEADGRFTYFYLFHLTGAIYRENGLDTGGHGRDGKRRFDPAIAKDSLRLDAETDESRENGGTLLDILPAGEDDYGSIKNAAARIFREQLHKTLESLIDGLPRDERILIRQKYYADRDRASIAGELHISKDEAVHLEDRALIHLRRNGKAVGLDQFLDSQINYYAGTGVKRFKETGSSSTERITIKRMEMKERYKMLLSEPQETS